MSRSCLQLFVTGTQYLSNGMTINHDWLTTCYNRQGNTDRTSKPNKDPWSKSEGERWGKEITAVHQHLCMFCKIENSPLRLTGDESHAWMVFLSSLRIEFKITCYRKKMNTPFKQLQENGWDRFERRWAIKRAVRFSWSVWRAVTMTWTLFPYLRCISWAKFSFQQIENLIFFL